MSVTETLRRVTHYLHQNCEFKNSPRTIMGIFSAKCMSQARLDGKTAVVTGCNTGIGKETVKDFFKRGARVILACRDEGKAKEALKDIINDCKGIENVGELQIRKLNLASLNSVRSCAKELLETEERIDLLINNAGVMMCPYIKTEDGFEMQFGTNHLGHFLFTLLLLPKICASTPARIVNVSSSGHQIPMPGKIYFDDLNFEKRPYSSLRAYQQSKLANVLFTKELARRLSDADKHGVNVYALHPGVIATELARHIDNLLFGFAWLRRIVMWCFVKTPVQGAQTTIYCSVDENCANETGLYYAECSVKTPHANTMNVEDARRLWEESLRLVGLDKDFDPFKRVL